MKLWIFVLLGLLAQTSHGCLQVQNYVIADRIKTTATGCTNDLQNRNLPDIIIALVGKLQVKILGLLKLDVTSSYTGQGIYTLNAKGTLQIGCGSLSPLKVEFSLTVKISHGIKNGKFCMTSDDSSIKITFKVLNAGGLSSALGILDLALKSVSAIIDALLPSLENILEDLVDTITDALTDTLESLTNELTVFGQNAQCKADSVTSTVTSTTFKLSLNLGSLDGVISFVDKDSIFGELDSGSFYAWSFGEGLLSSFLDLIGDFLDILIDLSNFDGVIPGLDVSKMKCKVKRKEPSECDLTSSGGTLTQTWELSFYDDLENIILEVTATTTSLLEMLLDEIDNLLTSVDNTQIESWTLDKKYDSCGCDNLVAGNLEGLVSSVIKTVNSLIKSILEKNPLPLGPQNPFGSKQSGGGKCSTKPQCVTCGK